MTSQVLKAFLISVILILFYLLVINNRNAYLKKFDPKFYQSLYQESQFASNKEDRKQVISDQDLYAYAGYYYLKTGDLDLINIEHPPLGKYLIGLSIIFFGNQNIIQIFWGILFLIINYQLAKILLNNNFLALLIPFFLLIEKLFQEQLLLSLLDLPIATVISLFILLTIKFKKNHFSLSPIILGILLGIIASIKFPVPAIILGCLYLFTQILTKNLTKMSKALIVLIISLLVYITSYSPLIIKRGLPGFLNLQVRALRVHLSHLPEYPKLVPLRVMFLNQWPVWWDKVNPIHQVEQWDIFWPILALAILFSPYFYYKYFQKIKQSNYLILFLFTWVYFIFINTRLFFPTYLLPVLSYLYLLLLWELKELKIC